MSIKESIKSILKTDKLIYEYKRLDEEGNVLPTSTSVTMDNADFRIWMLNMAVEDLRAKGISPAYLVTDHTGFYERYGWEFLCMVQGDGEPDMTRMYIHR